jgi:hypothetical protein
MERRNDSQGVEAGRGAVSKGGSMPGSDARKDTYAGCGHSHVSRHSRNAAPGVHIAATTRSVAGLIPNNSHAPSRPALLSAEPSSTVLYSRWKSIAGRMLPQRVVR